MEDHHGCIARDSITLFNDSPLSSFTSDAAPGCSPLQVNFSNISNGAVSYQWDFGDGVTSRIEHPVHTFTNISNSIEYYNTVLTAVSANNCTHTSNAYVTVYPNPEIEITTYPDQVYVRGESIRMESRQTLLRDRYLQESEKPPAFRH